MDLTTLEMPKDEASKAFREYRDAVRERHDDELTEIMHGYRALARGQQLLQLSDVMRQAGCDDRGLPRLAVCVADERWCRIEVRRSGAAVFIGCKDHDGGRSRWSLHRSGKRRVRLPEGTFDTSTTSREVTLFDEWRAMVPIVPPALRPGVHLRNYHVLWEATWAKTPRAPSDPALLKRVSRDLFAVVAVWDLTPLEQAVLSGRNNEE